MYYIFLFFPILFNMILFPFWCLGIWYGLFSVGLSNNYQNLINIAITPIFLLSLNVYFANKGIGKYYISIILSLLVLLINSVIKYIYWGVITGDLLNPDAETVMVSIYINTILPMILFVLMIGIFVLIKKIKKVHK